MRRIVIGVMGAGKDAVTRDINHAYELGEMIADAGWIVLSGGIGAGVMDAVSRGVRGVAA